MSNTAVPSQGVQIKRKVSGTYTLISEIHNFTLPQEKNPTLDVTSVDDSARKRISSKLFDGGTVTFDFWWKMSDAQQVALRTSMRAGTLEDFEVIIPDTGGGGNSTYQFYAFVDQWSGPKAGVAAALAGSAQLTISGDVTFTAAT